jgi:outer membrane protein
VTASGAAGARPVGRWAAGIAVALLGLVSSTASAQGIIDITPDYIPNHVGVGVGGVPDYVGSSDYMIGAAPIGRYSWGERYVSVTANFAEANLLDHPHWRLGPSATWRFGRDDVDDAAVDALPDIDGALELGGFVGYSLRTGDDARSLLTFNAGITQDVTGNHGGFVASVGVRKWFPVRDFAALGLAVGTSYGSGAFTDTFFSVTPSAAGASGLPAFEADGGLRDVRLTAVFVQAVHPAVVVGAGALYSRLLGDAADSPITDDSGSPNQLVFGIGAAYLF